MRARNRIGKEASTRCHHCDDGADSAQHTLEHCPAWTVPRCALTAEIGVNLLPPVVFRALLTSVSGRRADASFCEQVMLRN
jgi:hypothetical protein